MESKNTLSAWMKSLRQKRGISIPIAATMARIPEQTIIDLESEPDSVEITTEEATRLAWAYEVNPSAIRCWGIKEWYCGW